MRCEKEIESGQKWVDKTRIKKDKKRNRQTERGNGKGQRTRGGES